MSSAARKSRTVHRSFARSRLERRRDVGSSRLKRGNQPGEQSRERRSTPTNNRTRASVSTAGAAVSASKCVRMIAPPHCAMANAGDAAERARIAFGDELRQQPRSADAERDAHRDLAAALERAREQADWRRSRTR